MAQSKQVQPDLIFALRRVTEKAACAAFDWIGRGKSNEGDEAAVDAMRAALEEIDLDGTVVIGEGEKDEAPQLYNGERVGRPDAAFKADIAVDPVEGTSRNVIDPGRFGLVSPLKEVSSRIEALGDC